MNGRHVHFYLLENDSGFLVANDLNVKLKNAFAVVLKPGVLLGDTLGYGVIGARWGNFSFSSESNFLLTNAGFDVSAGNSKSQYKTGLTLGLGLEHYLCNNIYVTIFRLV